VIVGQSLVPGVIAGDQRPAERPAPTGGPELVEQWASASAAALAALTDVESFDEIVELPDGASSIEEFGWRLATDLTVHAWDLARAIGAPDVDQRFRG